MKSFTDGDKVKFIHPETGKETAGVIHGVRKVETNAGLEVLSYLIDTGKDAHTQEVVYNPRDVELGMRLDKKLKGDETPEQINTMVESINNQHDMPKSEVKRETIRQPETIDVQPKDVKAA